MSRLNVCAAAMALGLVCVSTTGCMFITSDHPQPAPRPNTLGRELRDLKFAHDEGAVSDEEYRTTKQRLLTSYDRR